LIFTSILWFDLPVVVFEQPKLNESVKLRDYAERSGYFLKTKVPSEALKELESSETKQVTFYDYNTGKPLFHVPVNRTWDEFIEESEKHGWPSFHDAETNWENVRCLKSTEAISIDGTNLGHNVPDRKGNRYCVNSVSVAGRPVDVDPK
jgi:peptide methionine sulfoxide reductase MsrB